MQPPLIKIKGSWEEVCKYHAEKISEKIPAGHFNKEEYVKWMMLQKDYSPNNYEHGTFFDIPLYLHCYLIYKKLNSDTNQHHMTLISGKIGKGKSVIASQIAALTDPTLNMERFCFIPPHLFRRLKECNKAEASIIDEGGNFFKSRNSMSKLGKDIAQAFQLVRDLRQHIIICYDEPEKLDKEIIDKIDTLIVKVYDGREKGDRQFRRYVGYNLKALDKIKPLLKKKIPISDYQVTKHISWKGHNTNEIPIVNDITENTYRTIKRKFLREHMASLENKYQEEYKDISVSKSRDYKNTKELVKPTMDISSYAKRKGMSINTIRNWIKKGELNAEKKGSKWWIDVSDEILA